jgi:multiple sugar transport system substrate-binding protein
LRTLFALILLGLGALSLVVWVTQPPAAPPGKTRLIRCADNNPVRQAQVDQYAKAHPEINLVLDPEGNAVEKIIVESVGGEGPDVYDSFDPTQLSAFVRAGIAEDLTDRLKADGFDLIKEVYPSALENMTYDGRIYGLPTNLDTNAIWVNEDLLKEVGEPVHKGPWTWKEFIPLAQKLTKRTPDGKPLQYGFYFDWWNWSHFFFGFGATPFTQDGRRCVVDSPQAIAAVQLMQDLVYKYKVSPTPIEEASNSTAGGFGMGDISLLGAKQTAMALGGRWWLVQLRSYKGLHLNVCESPYATVHSFGTVGRSLVVNKLGKHKDLAYQYVLSLAEPDYNNLVNAQGDGISAFKKYNTDSVFADKPEFPHEHGDIVWKQVAEFGQRLKISPYVDGAVTARIMTEQLDLVKANQKSAASAMHDAAFQINAEMKKNLDSDPILKARYDSTDR